MEERRQKQETISPFLLSALHRLFHDVRHPVTSIRYAAESALKRARNGTSVEHPIHDIFSLCDLLDIVVENMQELFEPSEYSRINKRSYSILEIHHAIKKQIKIVDHIGRKNDQVLIRINDAFFNSQYQRLDIDLRCLTRIAHEIISNAVRYSDRNTEVQVDLQTEQTSCRFVVTNYCSEVPSDLTKHCFDEGWRGEYARNYFTGLGLGLTVAKRLAEINNWNLIITSNPPLVLASLEIPTEVTDE